MTPDQLTQELKAATAGPPSGARERIWRRFAQPTVQPRASWALAFGGLAAVAVGALVVVAFFQNRASPSLTVRGDGYVVLGRSGSTIENHHGTLRLSSGAASVSSWAGKTRIEAATHTIEAEAAVFFVSVAGDAVTLAVDEGEVTIDSEHVQTHSVWPRGAVLSADVAGVRALEPREAPAERAWREAERSLDEGKPVDAASLFDEVGRRSDLRAEAALVRSAQLHLWELKQPDQALERLGEARRRFPHGDLGQEIALSRIEALVTLQRWPEAGAEARELLVRFPNSERRVDLQVISASDRWRAGKRAEACSGISSLSRDSVPPALIAAFDQVAHDCRK